MSQSDDSLSDEDRAFFQAAMRGVKPLGTEPRVPRVKREQVVEKKSERNRGVNLARPYAVVSDVPHHQAVPYDYVSAGIMEAVQSDSVLSYCQPGIPHKRYLELKRGNIPWRARLDLHGKTVELAYSALVVFLESQYYNNSQCVLIIHGKGGQQGQVPVLKNSVNQWLRYTPYVLAFHSAVPRDGGAGAVYVLLKRCRDSGEISSK